LINCCTWLVDSVLRLTGWSMAASNWLIYCCIWLVDSLLHLAGWFIAASGWLIHCCTWLVDSFEKNVNLFHPHFVQYTKIPR
jgi:hypothetical protein